MIVEQWTDKSTTFARKETNAQIFMGHIKHIVHHRGQVTVLMRQAGINLLEFMDHRKKIRFLIGEKIHDFNIIRDIFCNA